MTYAANGTSVRRNLPFLTPAERAVFEPTEAELIAGDRLNNIAKNMCVDLRARYRLQQEINETRCAS